MPQPQEPDMLGIEWTCIYAHNHEMKIERSLMNLTNIFWNAFYVGQYYNIGNTLGPMYELFLLFMYWS